MSGCLLNHGEGGHGRLRRPLCPPGQCILIGSFYVAGFGFLTGEAGIAARPSIVKQPAVIRVALLLYVVLLLPPIAAPTLRQERYTRRYDQRRALAVTWDAGTYRGNRVCLR